MGRTRTEYEFEDEDGTEALQRAGKALQAPLKGKDAAVRLLKVRGRRGGCRAGRGTPIGRAITFASCTTQSAGEHLSEAAQDSENARLASRDLARALVRPDLLRHRDQVRAGGGGERALRVAGRSGGVAHPSPSLPAALQEVRLYVALCLCHILRLNAPDTPYRDDELQARAARLEWECWALPALPPCAHALLRLFPHGALTLLPPCADHL